ncbi:DUF3427 domain-containing protein [Aquisalimonas sp.]|uniref:DUF3427 domain-containing protein n=1 Tax=Aquisalimonas sp. TaxID=1872621 RepID=UPI0025BCC3FC|nr:DUF3427 domain-containing protein [Aquisalimonas sp.]
MQSTQHHLITGGSDRPLIRELLDAIHRADEIELAVAFIKVSGLEMLFQALAHRLEEEPKACVRILTSDYLDVTDPIALRRLMLLAEAGADVRVYESRGHSFHLKAYIFVRTDKGVLCGDAFVGSSNISQTALTSGLEWNYRVVDPGDVSDSGRLGFAEIRAAFRRLFDDPAVTPLSHTWIEDYERRRRPNIPSVAPGSDEPEPAPAQPSSEQQQALDALSETREAGFRRGLVVMATGLGKTFLAAFDARQMGAKRVLFIAHREEILLQAEATFQRVLPRARVGQYYADQRDEEADMVFASVQTLHRQAHLRRFARDHFDYIVVDEFHHATASTYRRLLQHFAPRFLLGLTATPDRSDQADILALCDDNLVYTRNLFDGVQSNLLCPFSYYGIFDEYVDYEEIPWRNGRFDADTLSTRLATLARARHALREWRDKAGSRTLAFCVSTSHADFMADQFAGAGIPAVAVHSRSAINRHDALEQLRDGSMQVIFSVDLFNEGVDVPDIDTVMMLRPTESKILFLQQIGRGLRPAPNKERLTILDFIGNHKGFLNKPQALFEVAGTRSAIAAFADRAEKQEIELPPGCYVNYDLQLIEFLKSLNPTGIADEYDGLKASTGRRPTLLEFYRFGASIDQLRRQYGSWWAFVDDQGDLEPNEQPCFQAYGDFFREVETTAMNKSFKMVLLEALLEMDGFRQPPTTDALAAASLEVLRRRPDLASDLEGKFDNLDTIDPAAWRGYWEKHPINAWTGGNQGKQKRPWFTVSNGHFVPAKPITSEHSDQFASMLQELVDYRLARYRERRGAQGTETSGDVVPFPGASSRPELPYFPNIRVACGHFKSGQADAEEYRTIGPGHGRIDPSRHFIAQASGESMNGGRNPIHDGDYLLLEHVTPTKAGSITGDTMVIERQDDAGDSQYLLRVVTKGADGSYILKATNPEYSDLVADESMRTRARLQAVLDPLELALGQRFMREDIPSLFGEAYNPGSWQSGHVVLRDQNVHVLLVTLNKQGKGEDHRYQDYFIDDHTFHWQTQNSTTPESKRGREIIEHDSRGIAIHLFVRENKLGPNGKAAPFQYLGPVDYVSHAGTAPMSVTFRLER